MTKSDVNCSFCGKTQQEAHRLLTNDEETVYICEECVAQFGQLFKEQTASKQGAALEIKLTTPMHIKAELDKYVIGQEYAKKSLSVAVYNHYKRLLSQQKSDEVELGKSNILLIGPTGSGKTLLAETLARTLNVPFTIADATSMTEAGYVGDDIETMLQKLLARCDYDVAKAEAGIIYIDEIDKVARKGENMSITRDVSGEGVQQGLLKIIEGTIARVPVQGKRKHAQQDCVDLNTKNILFICGGAFDGLEKIIQARTARRSIGFSASIIKEDTKRQMAELLQQAEPEDLIKFGLIPEFIGRLPIMAVLNELNETELIQVLTQPKNALIKQYQYLFNLEKIVLNFTPEALTEIAKKATKKGAGARGLRSIIESLLLDTMFKVPSLTNLSEVMVDASVVMGKQTPLLKYSSSLEPVIDLRGDNG